MAFRIWIRMFIRSILLGWQDSFRQEKKKKNEGLKNMLFLNENKLGHSNAFFQVISGGKNPIKKNIHKIIMFLSIFNKSYQRNFFFSSHLFFSNSCLYTFEEAPVSRPRAKKKKKINKSLFCSSKHFKHIPALLGGRPGIRFHQCWHRPNTCYQ